jgi:hypothetical protein
MSYDPNLSEEDNQFWETPRTFGGDEYHPECIATKDECIVERDQWKSTHGLGVRARVLRIRAGDVKLLGLDPAEKVNQWVLYVAHSPSGRRFDD